MSESNRLENMTVEKVIPDVWPDAELAKQMLADATELADGAEYFSDCQCHVAALLERVRELEEDRLKWRVVAGNQALNANRLCDALEEYADHAADSGWHNLAGEIRRRMKEAVQ